MTVRTMGIIVVLLTGFLCSCSCSSTTQHGVASYYADKFHGRKTASGEKYNKNAFTAAHPELPFGTQVKVTNLSNGKTVTVRINDRGPHAKGRIIDLSRAAASKIGLIGTGTAKVRLDVLPETSK